MALRGAPNPAYSNLAGRQIRGSILVPFGLFALGLVDAALLDGVSAQTSNYLIPAPRVTIQAPGTNGALRAHRNAIGKPCLDFEAMSRAHRANPDIYDNIVSIRNQCAQRIVVSVCYAGSDGCIGVEVPAFQRKDAILGVRPQSQYFRYTYKEKF